MVAAADPAVSPALAPPPGSPRFPAFDGLRAIAILMVFVFHATGLAGLQGATDLVSGRWESSWSEDVARQLYAGVSIFFAISGFLLYRPYVAARAGRGRRPTLRGFARRRALRIIPAYWVALTLLGLAGEASGAISRDFWIYYGFLQIYDLDTFPRGIQVAWSLCVELSFYVLLPLFALGVDVLARRVGRIRADVAALAAVEVACLAFRWACRENVIPEFLQQTLGGQATFFVVGMSLAVASVALEGREDARWSSRLAVHRPLVLWAGAVGAYCIAAIACTTVSLVSTQFSSRAYYANHVLTAVAACLLLAPACFHASPRGLVWRFLTNRAVAWVGLVSYALFLWHVPILRKLWTSGVEDAPVSPFLALVAAGLAAGLAIAAASYYVVELPFLRRKERAPRDDGTSAGNRRA